MMGLSNCMMEPSNPLKKIIESRVCRAPPWGENSWNRVWNHKFFPRSPIHKIVGDFGNKMLDILKIRQDATVCRSEQFPIFWPAGILQVGFGFSILNLMIFEKNGPYFRFSTTQISYGMIRVSWVWALNLISNIFYRRIWKLYNPCHISMYRCLSFAWHQRRS